MEQITTIKIENGELYVQGDKIVGRMVNTGSITRWYKGDKLHREGDLPARIEQNNDGVVIHEVHYRDGKKHRDGDLPAIIWRNAAGVVTYEGYWRDGREHRDGDLPANIWRNNAGVVTHEEYYRDGRLHRNVNESRDLPASIWRNDAGVITFKAYYRDGVKISSADIKTAKLAQELAAANEQIAKLTAEVEQLCGENTLMREKLQKIRALVE